MQVRWVIFSSLTALSGFSHLNGKIHCVCVCVFVQAKTHTPTHTLTDSYSFMTALTAGYKAVLKAQGHAGAYMLTHTTIFFPPNFFIITEPIASQVSFCADAHAHNFFLTHQVPHCTHKAHTHQMKCWCYKKTAVFNLSLKLNRRPTRTQSILHAVQVMFRTDSAVCLLYLICMQCGVKVPARWTKSPLGH